MKEFANAKRFLTCIMAIANSFLASKRAGNSNLQELLLGQLVHIDRPTAPPIKFDPPPDDTSLLLSKSYRDAYYLTGCILNGEFNGRTARLLTQCYSQGRSHQREAISFFGARAELWLTVLPSAHLYQNYIPFEKFLEKIYA